MDSSSSSKKKLSPNLTPKIISIYDLRERLLPIMGGWSWAEDALMDLWRMGAPDPSPGHQPCSGGVSSCVHKSLGSEQCLPKWGCRLERRVLLPGQFATWWAEVAARQGSELTAEQALTRRKN